MNDSIYTGLYVCFSDNQYKFGPYYRKILSIIEKECHDSLELLHNVEYDIYQGIHRNTITISGLNLDNCKILDMTSIIILFLFCVKVHRKNIYSMDFSVFNRLLKLEHLATKDVKQFINFLKTDNLQINLNRSRCFIDDKKRYVYDLIYSNCEKSQLLEMFKDLLNNSSLISKTYFTKFKYFYWLEDSEEILKSNEIFLKLNVSDLIDHRTMQLDDELIYSIIDNIKKQYENKIINLVSTTLRWRPTLEVLGHHLFNSIKKNCIHTLNFLILSNDEQEVEIYDKNESLLNHCLTIGASI
jgi:hypothetical protein